MLDGDLLNIAITVYYFCQGVWSYLRNIIRYEIV